MLHIFYLSYILVFSLLTCNMYLTVTANFSDNFKIRSWKKFSLLSISSSHILEARLKGLRHSLQQIDYLQHSHTSQMYLFLHPSTCHLLLPLSFSLSLNPPILCHFLHVLQYKRCSLFRPGLLGNPSAACNEMDRRKGRERCGHTQILTETEQDADQDGH